MSQATGRSGPQQPYEDVVVGEPVEVSVFEDGDGALVATCEFRGDAYGGKVVLDGSELERKLATDELVESVASLVWNELLGTPVFREEDDEWVGRVAARARWLGTPRTPTRGWVRRALVPEAEPGELELAGSRSEREAAIGDANVEELRLSQEEMAALTHGEIPGSLVERLLRSRSVPNLLESVAETLERIDNESGRILRAQQEVAELRRRLS